MNECPLLKDHFSKEISSSNSNTSIFGGYVSFHGGTPPDWSFAPLATYDGQALYGVFDGHGQAGADSEIQKALHTLKTNEYPFDLPPTQDASHHHDYYIFSRESLLFVTVTGWGVESNISPENCCLEDDPFLLILLPFLGSM